MRRLAALALVGVLVLTGCSGTPERKQSAPDLPATTLASFAGGTGIDLSTLRGPAVVNVWASWCGPCRRELPLYQAFSRAYAGRVKVLGVDFQDTRVDRARRLIRQTGVTYPLYSDPDGRLRSRALPQLYLIDGRGRVAHAAYVEITSLAQLEKLVRTHLGVGA